MTTLIFSGCTTHTRTVYIDKPVEVKIPVKCIVPDTNCSFNKKSDTAVISSMLECIIDLKHAAKSCQ